jgi:hypothetical protein
MRWRILNRKKAKNENGQEVVNAASLLQVSEYQFFQIAYYRWFGRRDREREIEEAFNEYLEGNAVPYWVRHLSRRVIALNERKILRIEEFGIPPPETSLWLRIKGLLFLLLIIAVLLVLILLLRDYPSF